MEKKRVVVTGLGALTPLGNTVDTYWNNLIAGKSGADYITKFDASLFKTQFACEVKDLTLWKLWTEKRFGNWTSFLFMLWLQLMKHFRTLK